jgi:hypothetical protein
MKDSPLYDSPLSFKKNLFAVEADGARVPYPPTQTPPELPRDVAMQVAERARVPAGKCEPFCNAICESVQTVWETDRRAVSSKPNRALFKAAEAARTLNEAICSLNKDDREWVERIMARSEYQELPREFLLTISQIDHMFSTAIGESSPLIPGTAVLREKKGRRRGAVKDITFEVFIRQILLWAAEYDGEFTHDKNFKKGTLIEVLNILRPHLPKGVVPNALPYGTIQKIKTKFLKPTPFSKPLSIPAK